MQRECREVLGPSKEGWKPVPNPQVVLPSHLDPKESLIAPSGEDVEVNANSPPMTATLTLCTLIADTTQ
ncbi:hypothetical protein KI387_033668, partial [Taxus chinensis]